MRDKTVDIERPAALGDAQPLDERRAEEYPTRTGNSTGASASIAPTIGDVSVGRPGGVEVRLVHDGADGVEPRIASRRRLLRQIGIVARKIAKVVTHAHVDHRRELVLKVSLIRGVVVRAQDLRREPRKFLRVALRPLK